MEDELIIIFHVNICILQNYILFFKEVIKYDGN